MNTRKKKRRIWPWFLLILLLGGGAFVVLGNKATPAPTLDPALLLPVKRSTLAIDIIETGKITPREKVEIKSRVAGQVLEVRIDEGEHVTKDQLVVVLDPTDYEREASRAQIDLDQAKAALAFAKTNFTRIEAGVAGNVIQSSDLIAAKHEVTTRSIAVKAAEVARGITLDRVRYTRILSPIQGTVMQRNIQPGEVVVPGVQSTFDGKSLLTIGDVSVLLVEVDLNQIDAAKVRIGQKVTVTLDALPGKTYDASITKIAPASIRRPGKDYDCFPIEARLDKVDSEIKPGMTADVRIHVEKKADVLVLPLEAIRREKGKNLVSRVIKASDGKQTTERIEVTLGARSDRDVEIAGGIVEGDQIFIDPAPATANETKL